MARTANEEARRLRLAKIREAVRKDQLKGIQAIDYSLLPVETKVSLCVAEYDPAEEVMLINDDPVECAAALNIKTNQLTLRQANFGVYKGVASRTEIVAMEMKATFHGSSRSYKSITLDALGRSLYVAKTSAELAPTQSQTDHRLGEHINQNRERYGFIPQHMTKFPATYFGREQVSFLGLPRDTIVPLKNGGEFKVVHRNVNALLPSGEVTGTLTMAALDDKAKRLAALMAWNVDVMNNYIVPANLYTERTGGNNFDIAAIRIPYRDPFDNQRGWFRAESRLKYPNGKGMNFGKTTTPLEDALDDLLFG